MDPLTQFKYLSPVLPIVPENLCPFIGVLAFMGQNMY